MRVVCLSKNILFTFQAVRMSLKEKCQDLGFLQIKEAWHLLFSNEEMQLSYRMILIKIRSGPGDRLPWPLWSWSGLSWVLWVNALGTDTLEQILSEL